MSYTVKTKEEAWNKANELFPTDYEQDSRATDNAGYPIYQSTSLTNGSWISDLGNSLELNIVKNEGSKNMSFDTIRIYIKPEPEITEVKTLEMEDVLECCMRHDLYTKGNIREYDNMLRMANREFSLRLLYDIALDIAEHSEAIDTEGVMFLLNKEAVVTTYKVKH